MKKFIKSYGIFLGALAIIVAIFVVLAICGTFNRENIDVLGTYSFERLLKENEMSYPQNDSTVSDRWVEEPNSIPGVLNSTLHTYLSSQEKGYYKHFNSQGFQNFYYNERHGYFVLLPNEMGYNQLGEHPIGDHWNEFYNCDTSLVVSCGANFYDVVLLDYPHYMDTLRIDHLKRLSSKGKVQILSSNPAEIIAKVIVDRTIEKSVPSDYLVSKWILKKDIEDRECEMWLNIFYNDSLSYRKDEFLKIIEYFPNNPFKQ